MSRLLYADTGASVALVYTRDHAHAHVSAHLREALANGDRLRTCEPVISPTVTRLRYDGGLAQVQTFRDIVSRAVAQRVLNIRESSAELRRAGFDTQTLSAQWLPGRAGQTPCSGSTTTSDHGLPAGALTAVQPKHCYQIDPDAVGPDPVLRGPPLPQALQSSELGVGDGLMGPCRPPGRSWS